MTLASIVGFIIASGIFTLFMFALFASAFSGEQTVRIKKNTILKITLSTPVVDFAHNSIDPITFSVNQQTSLYRTLKAVENAIYDPNIKGMYMDLSQYSINMASAEEIREAMEAFKKSGKFIICYADNYSQGAYYFATVADKIYLNPYGSAMLSGMSSQVMFYKNMLDKLGIEMQVIRHGKFKSAVEPFMVDKMSPENREQITAYMGSIWNFLMEEISKSRNISVEELNRLADQLTLNTAESALQHGLVDGIMYKDEVIAELCEKMGVDSEKKLNIVNFSDYVKLKKKESDQKNKKDKVAVVYASGDIVMGESTGNVSSEYISKAIRRVREDETIKAVVFRVNSPGGDAQASEIIARELELTAKEKPVIVSMGSLAASGGYWISTPGSVILANHTTLTGSIGVFGMAPNVQKGMNDFTGLTVEAVNTNEHSDAGSIFRPLSQYEKDFLQAQVEDIYDKFITKVADSRHMTKGAIDSIGQGRVWSGVNAHENGLIDAFGGLNTAITVAAERANITEYHVVERPMPKGSPMELFMSFMDAKIFGADQPVSNDLKRTFSKYEHIIDAITRPGVKARMEYDIELQ